MLFRSHEPSADRPRGPLATPNGERRRATASGGPQPIDMDDDMAGVLSHPIGRTASRHAEPGVCSLDDDRHDASSTDARALPDTGSADDPDATGELPSVVLPPAGERISLIDELMHRDGVFDRATRGQPASRLPEPRDSDPLGEPAAESFPDPPHAAAGDTGPDPVIDHGEDERAGPMGDSPMLERVRAGGVARLPVPLRRLLHSIVSMPAPDGSLVRIRLWKRDQT